MPNLIVFTDLDGSLLDGTTYSYEAAIPALTALREQGIPLVLVSSKTRAEMEPTSTAPRPSVTHSLLKTAARCLSLKGLFDFPLERMRTRSPYQVIELGLPYHMLREVLKQIEEAVETPLQGFGDLSVEAIMQVTGLPHADAILAKQREYDEPYPPARPSAAHRRSVPANRHPGPPMDKRGAVISSDRGKRQGRGRFRTPTLLPPPTTHEGRNGADRNGWDR